MTEGVLRQWQGAQLAPVLGLETPRLEAYAATGLEEVVLVPATAGDPGGERTLTALASFR